MVQDADDQDVDWDRESSTTTQASGERVGKSDDPAPETAPATTKTTEADSTGKPPSDDDNREPLQLAGRSLLAPLLGPRHVHRPESPAPTPAPKGQPRGKVEKHWLLTNQVPYAIEIASSAGGPSKRIPPFGRVEVEDSELQTHPVEPWISNGIIEKEPVIESEVTPGLALVVIWVGGGLGTTEQGVSGTQFRVDYLKPSGAIGFYHPDWVVVQNTDSGDVNWIVETKGRVWESTAAKDDATRSWCKRVSDETGIAWRYKRINQANFDGQTSIGLADVVVPRT